ncbi:MAG: ATP-binding protein [Fimbriimonadaceae bacterium]|nr:ATP-binding protein [Fimbriimonadaceae bacterium]
MARAGDNTVGDLQLRRQGNLMATAEQLKALLHSYATADEDRFLSVALQIASGAARSGKQRLGDELRDLVDQAKRHRAAARQPVVAAVPLVRSPGELAGLVAASCPQVRLSDMVLAPTTHSRLERVVREYRQTAVLDAHGLQPRRKLLLVGPPGSGKTMTATALAGELGLPLLQVQLHGLITKFMGETAAKLHVVFQAMQTTRGVYLFDEFDAIGATRGADNDIGEVRRILNSFLQFLEQDSSDSLLVAATNLSGMLDSALMRRFDDVIQYDLPDAAMIKQLVRNRLALFDTTGLRWGPVTAAAGGLSHAEVVRGCEDAAKDAVLDGRQRIMLAMLVRALSERRSARSPLGSGQEGWATDAGARTPED